MSLLTFADRSHFSLSREEVKRMQLEIFVATNKAFAACLAGPQPCLTKVVTIYNS